MFKNQDTDLQKEIYWQKEVPIGRYNVPSREDCFADLLKAAKYAPNPYYLQGKVISQVLSKPWPVVSAIIHPQSFLANFVLLSSNLQGLTLSTFFRIPN